MPDKVIIILNRITVKLGFRKMADNRVSQNVLLRSSAINCVFEIVWKAKICNRNVNYNTTNSVPWLNAPVFWCRIISLQITWYGFNLMLITRTQWKKFLGMNAFIIATARIFNTWTKKANLWEKIGENFHSQVVHSENKCRSNSLRSPSQVIEKRK